MPEECQYLRVRLKTEQCRLLDWADTVRLDETDDNLLISNSSKGLLLDVLDQQQRLIIQFGRLDDKYHKLSRPLLVDYEDTDPPAYEATDKGNPPIQRTESNFRSRFPRNDVLLKKSLQWAKQTTTYPKKLKWAVFDKGKMESLAIKLAAFNDFMQNMLNTQQLENLAIKQQRTEFQIIQLNSTISHLVQIFDSAAQVQMNKGAGTSRRRSKQLTDPIQAYLSARGLSDMDSDEDDGADTLNVAYPNSFHANRSGGLQNLAALAQFKALNSAIQDPSIFTDEFTSSIGVRSASETLNVELSRSDIHLLEDENSESQRVEAYYQRPRSRKLSVWIEWKTYEPPPFPSHFHQRNSSSAESRGGPDPKILERVKALAALLKENSSTTTSSTTTNKNQFRAPNCLGYFHDTNPQTGDTHPRFGLVFLKPSKVHSTTLPLSLHALLTSPPNDLLSTIPSLTSRIALMLRLAETLERLHAVNWLHKGLRSSNILFFDDCGASHGLIDFSDPLISGFDYSRPAMNDDMTEKPPENAAEDIYRHPNVQGAGGRDPLGSSSSSGGLGGFKKSYDIYALGVILLEIAYWKPIERIVGIKDLERAKPRETFRVRESLLSGGEGSGKGEKGVNVGNDVLGYVRSHLGDTIERVIRACLEGPVAFGVVEGEDERREEVGATLQRGFYERVVAELGKVRI
ncbi:unnamed protein product [Periconia digitata]|uniref:Protein kinase domain-containing protein n=1 Tax=Periconia digitata TaxID=1303443 RepID=A0A9W4UPD4_9PLEO|nr:unnamed protein product [Periconia digitata]